MGWFVTLRQHSMCKPVFECGAEPKLGSENGGHPATAALVGQSSADPPVGSRWALLVVLMMVVACDE